MSLFRTAAASSRLLCKKTSWEAPLLQCQVRSLKKRSSGGALENTWRRISQPTRKYFKDDFKASDGTKLHCHIVQSGDSILRQVCQPINPADIQNHQIQAIIKNLKDMLVKYEGIGMSACQVGIPVRMSVIQFTPAQLNTWSACLLYTSPSPRD